MRFRFCSLNPADTQIRISIGSPWSTPPSDAGDVHFLRTWLTYDSGSDERSSNRVNWNAVLGMLLVFTVSAGFWSGVGLAVSEILR
jgi:hypothetical protein